MIAYLFLFIHLLFAVFLFYLIIAFVTGAPYVPSSSDAAQTMIRLARIQRGMIVYDLGSGDGKLLFQAAKMGAHAIGFEMNPYLVFFTWVRILFSKERAHIHVYWKNIWTANIKDADVVFLYLIPWHMKKMSTMLKKQCKSGTKIVSNSFIFDSMKLLDKDESKHIYVFEIP